jgi:type II secretory pathway component GspD/PulD (secretin)
VQIDVTPRIAADGRITLDVEASVDDLLSTAADPTFQNLATRNVSTTISVEEGQTVLLGGLLQNSLTLSAGRSRCSAACRSSATCSRATSPRRTASTC